MKWIVLWQTRYEHGVEMFDNTAEVETFCNRQHDWTLLECYRGYQAELEAVKIKTEWRVKL